MNVAVVDPYNVIQDPEMPTLALALDPVHVAQEFRKKLPHVFSTQDVDLVSIRVIRHKPNRRCIIEYEFNRTIPGGAVEKVFLIGKVMAHRYGKSGYRLLRALWNAGFDARSEDGVSVPEPIGHIPSLQMWLQRKVPGRIATDLLTTSEGPGLLRRIALAAHKLHTARVATTKSHMMTDELRILWERVPKVALAQPAWSSRIDNLLKMAEQLGAMLPPGESCGIHRDFYSDQIIVDDTRLHLIDFDLYCNGSPGLDIGNFIGHITELSLRTSGDPHTLVHLEQAIEEEFVALSGPSVRAEVKTYAALTRVRHIYISTLFSERRSYTKTLLDYCEQELAEMITQPACAQV